MDQRSSDRTRPREEKCSGRMRRLACAYVLALLASACGSGSAGNGAPASGGAGGAAGSSSGGAVGTDGGVAGTGSSGTGGSGGKPTFRVALSVSPFTGKLFSAGAVYSDGKILAHNAAELQAMYVVHGANEVFARISCELDPTGSADDHSLTAGLARAKLAHDMSLPFNPELGLWKHYGDISCQPPPDFSGYPGITLPGAWGTLSIGQMLPAFHDYGALVATRLTQTGVNVDVWDIGNEVDFGVAGVAPQGIPGDCSTPYVAPDGIDPAIGKQTVVALLTMSDANRISWLQAHVWPDEAKIFAAVADGIRSVVPNARFATHMSQSRDPTFATAFYQAMFDGGFSPDVLGFSFYPSASTDSNKVQNFRATVDAVHQQFQRPVFIAEFAYPAGPTSTGPYASWNNAVPNYPISENGQAAFLRDMAGWAYASGLAGIRPWAPEVFTPGWEGFALFQAPAGGPAMARKALDSIAQGIANPDPAAFHD